MNTEQNQAEKVAYSIREAAEFLGYNEFTLYRLVARGVIRASTGCRVRRIHRKELERFLLGEK